ncbi:MAG: tetratricopeptide repeat protein [Rhodospirillales bacterium]|nr:tetratricopeptide repeat protein [Rhodospirillales bacterium]
MNRAEKRHQRKLAEKAARTSMPDQPTTMLANDEAAGVQKSLELAMAHHQAGRLPEAAAIYQQILQSDPNQPVALHLLGVIALQTGDSAGAVELITKAITIDPAFAEAYGNLGVAQRNLGNLEEAVASYQKAISCNPEHGDAHYQLGNTLKRLGRTLEAVASFRTVIALNGQFAEAHNNLGNALQDLGKSDEAVQSFQKALAIKPDYANAHNNLGTALSALGDLGAAEESYRKALALDGNFAEAQNNLGNVLKDRGMPEAAVQSLQKALAIKPDYAEAHNNLGNVFKSLGKLEEAVDCYRKAITINPGFVEALNNIGNVLDDLGKLDEAVESYRLALVIDPDFAEAHNNLGNTLKSLGRHVEAIESFNRAIAINAQYGEAYNNLGNVFKELGRWREALDCYQKALTIKPEYVDAHSNLIFTMQYSPEATAEDILEEALRWDKQHSNRDVVAAFKNTPDPERKLRVGYVSADFRMHAVSYLLEPLLESHDRDEIELFCYAEVARPDQVTERFKNLSDHWRQSVGLSNEQLVALVRDDKIDILVDCTGHTANSRLLAMTHKPAPILVNHYIMPGMTSGVSAMDYVLSNPVISPPGLEEQFSEEVVIVPHCAFAFRPDSQWPDVAQPRQNIGGPIFACVGDPARIGTQTVTLWSSLLDMVTDSCIVFKHGAYGDPQTREYWKSAFKELGARALFEGVEGGWNMNMDFYGRVDVVLDTLPMSGGTSSIIPLWMGVPLVTMAGGYYCHNSGTAMVSHVDMEDLSAENPEDYLCMVSNLVQDRQHLDFLRRTLRETLKASPIMDARGRANEVEVAFRKMWQKWCVTQES